jgi:dipeptidyl-peptidase-4
MLVDSLKLGTGAEISEEEKMRRERARIAGTKGITAYQWSPDGRALLVPLDGDLYVASLDGSVRRYTETKETELDSRLSETGRFLSFVRNQNLYVIDAATGQERALTSDGGGVISWGSAEFVAQEEMDRHEGHWWSPNDDYLASRGWMKDRLRSSPALPSAPRARGCSSSAIRPPAPPMPASTCT